MSNDDATQRLQSSGLLPDSWLHCILVRYMKSTNMIPQFPDFKHVEVDDREAVEAHTHRYEPYSDFNFTSLWAWDTSGERMISELNGNLVVRFTDYSTHEPFLSFLGDSQTEHTAKTFA